MTDLPPAPHATDAARIDRLGLIATWILRYGLALLLIEWGIVKFAAFEAEAIRPLVEANPLVSCS